jgi:hypothetical protein
VLTLAAAMGKRLDAAWAAGGTPGATVGGLFTGVKAISTWYAVHLIRHVASGAIDAGFDTSAIAANRPDGWTAFRRLGWIRTDGAGNILAFEQHGADFFLKALASDKAYGYLANANRTLLTVTAPPNSIARLVIVSGTNTGVGFGYVASTSFADVVPSNVNSHISASTSYNSQEDEVPVDASSQVAYRGNTTNLALSIMSAGWIDERVA